MEMEDITNKRELNLPEDFFPFFCKNKRENLVNSKILEKNIKKVKKTQWTVQKLKVLEDSTTYDFQINVNSLY